VGSAEHRVGVQSDVESMPFTLILDGLGAGHVVQKFGLRFPCFWQCCTALTVTTSANRLHLQWVCVVAVVVARCVFSAVRTLECLGLLKRPLFDGSCNNRVSKSAAACVNGVDIFLMRKRDGHAATLSISSGQIKCQSVGHSSWRVTALLVAFSMATANFTGTGRWPLAQFERSDVCAPIDSASRLADPRPCVSK